MCACVVNSPTNIIVFLILEAFLICGGRGIWWSWSRSWSLFVISSQIARERQCRNLRRNKGGGGGQSICSQVSLSDHYSRQFKLVRYSRNFSKTISIWSKTTLNYWMMVERYPNIKEEVGGSIPGCEIASLLDMKLARWWLAS